MIHNAKLIAWRESDLDRSTLRIGYPAILAASDGIAKPARPFVAVFRIDEKFVYLVERTLDANPT